MMWKLTQVENGDIHIYPRDGVGHRKERDCPCEPDLLTRTRKPASLNSPNRVVVVHNDPDEERNAA